MSPTGKEILSRLQKAVDKRVEQKKGDFRGLTIEAINRDDFSLTRRRVDETESLKKYHEESTDLSTRLSELLEKMGLGEVDIPDEEIIGGRELKQGIETKTEGNFPARRIERENLKSDYIQGVKGRVLSNLIKKDVYEEFKHRSLDSIAKDMFKYEVTPDEKQIKKAKIYANTCRSEEIKRIKGAIEQGTKTVEDLYAPLFLQLDEDNENTGIANYYRLACDKYGKISLKEYKDKILGRSFRRTFKSLKVNEDVKIVIDTPKPKPERANMRLSAVDYIDPRLPAQTKKRRVLREASGIDLLRPKEFLKRPDLSDMEMILAVKFRKSEIIEGIEEKVLDGKDFYVTVSSKGWSEKTAEKTNKILENVCETKCAQREGKGPILAQEQKILDEAIKNKLLPSICNQNMLREWGQTLKKTDCQALKLLFATVEAGMEGPVKHDLMANISQALFPPPKKERLLAYETY